MAKQSSGASGSGSGSRRRRRAPTIDLSAEEVKRGVEIEAAGEGASAAAGEEAAGEGERTATAPARAEQSAAGAERREQDHATAQDEEREPVMPSAFAMPPRGGAPEAAPPARGRGAVAAGLLLAALAGGIIVLAGLVAVDRAGLLPLTGGTEETAALRAEVASLEQELAAARQSAELEAEDLQAQVADLNERLAALAETQPGEAAPAEPAATDPALADQVAALDAALEGLRDEIGAASAPEGLEEVGERLERLEGLPEQVAQLGERVEAVQAAPGTGAAEAVQSDVAGLRDRLAELEADLEGLARRLENVASAEALGNLESELSAARQDIEAGLATIQQNAEAERSELAARLERLQALAPAVAAEALAGAVATGRPFASELQAVRSLGADKDRLSDLAPHAEEGLPSRAALRRRFADIADELRQAEAPPPSDAGPLERLLHSARNVVEVRPAGPQPGDSPSAVASRIEAALAAGDLSRALEEWQALSPEAQEASQDWAAQARAVLAAETLAEELRSDALARLAQRS